MESDHRLITVQVLTTYWMPADDVGRRSHPGRCRSRASGSSVSQIRSPSVSTGVEAGSSGSEAGIQFVGVRRCWSNRRHPRPCVGHISRGRRHRVSRPSFRGSTSPGDGSTKLSDHGAVVARCHAIVIHGTSSGIHTESDRQPIVQDRRYRRPDPACRRSGLHRCPPGSRSGSSGSETGTQFVVSSTSE